MSVNNYNSNCSAGTNVWQNLKKWLLFAVALFVLNSLFAQENKAIDSLLNVLNSSKEDTIKVNLLNDISTEFLNASSYLKAELYAKKALQLAEKLQFKKGIGATYRKIGNIYLNQNKFPEALKIYLYALKISEEITDKKGIVNCYQNIGNIYSEMSKYNPGCREDAIKYYHKALDIAKETGNKKAMASVYYKLGMTNRIGHNYAEGVKDAQIAQSLFRELGDKQGMLRAQIEIADNYDNLHENDKAFENYKQALKMANEFGTKPALNIIHTNMGSFLWRRGNIGLARKHIDSSLTLSKEMNSKEALRVNYYILASIDSTVGNYKSAFNNYKLSTSYRDSLIVDQNSKQVAEMKEKYESEQKEKEITLLSKDKELQKLEVKKQKQAKNYFIAGFALIAAASFFAYNNYRTKQQLKLQALRNKIASDLHDDVGSTLSSIAIFSQMAQEQSKETIPLLQTIEESSRKMLDAMADIVWTINPENDQFERIIVRMRSFAYELLGAKNIDFEFVADDNVGNTKLPMEARKNLYLIFKEATNNMVKYAGADKATFVLKEDKKFLTMLIRDNGKGFDTGKETEGNGLKNMKKRAQEIGAELRIDSSPGNGTSINLRLAL